jgi:hypothetical protein
MSANATAASRRPAVGDTGSAVAGEAISESRAALLLGYVTFIYG